MNIPLKTIADRINGRNQKPEKRVGHGQTRIGTENLKLGCRDALGD